MRSIVWLYYQWVKTTKCHYHLRLFEKQLSPRFSPKISSATSQKSHRCFHLGWVDVGMEIHHQMHHHLSLWALPRSFQQGEFSFFHKAAELISLTCSIKLKRHTHTAAHKLLVCWLGLCFQPPTLKGRGPESEAWLPAASSTLPSVCSGRFQPLLKGQRSLKPSLLLSESAAPARACRS